MIIQEYSCFLCNGIFRIRILKHQLSGGRRSTNAPLTSHSSRQYRTHPPQRRGEEKWLRPKIPFSGPSGSASFIPDDPDFYLRLRFKWRPICTNLFHFHGGRGEVAEWLRYGFSRHIFSIWDFVLGLYRVGGLYIPPAPPAWSGRG